MINVGIIGATGYAGAELVRILSSHPNVKISIITSRQYANRDFDEVYPAMRGSVDLMCEEYSLESFVDKKVHVAFTALPHKLPMEFIPGLLESGVKVVDLSADFRFKNVSTYETYYQPHSAGDLIEQSVYGLCEVNFKDIKHTSLVGNPGCYPTSVLLPLIPLIKSRLIDFKSIIADSKSAVSGAGRSVSLATHFCEVNEGFKAYKVASHRHAPEMEEVLSKEADEPIQLTFVPHLVPATRGMLTTIYAGLEANVKEEDIRCCISDYYLSSPFVRIFPENTLPNISYVRGTNLCDIGIKTEERTGRLILISAIDNLVKGAAGQAVQNMNIMMGLDETSGLVNNPFPV
jgi:N-acetyl-gamma-glutamyl-phosphate reductase